MSSQTEPPLDTDNAMRMQELKESLQAAKLKIDFALQKHKELRDSMDHLLKTLNRVVIIGGGAIFTILAMEFMHFILHMR